MVQSRRVTQTVILAAGSGSRLASARGDVPKPLMTVAGVPLVAHALQHAAAAGCDEAVVVVGYEGGRVRDAIEAMQPAVRVTFVTNPDFFSPNGVSLLASEPVAAAEFYLQMVDHLFAEPVLARLSAAALAPGEAGRVLVDSVPSADIDLDDATKVRLVEGRVVAIGKGLDVFDAVDAGCFVLTHGVFEALRRVPAAEGRTVSSGMRQLVAHRALGAVDVRGAEWIDVDTPADREVAERLIGRRQLASERP
ncbi:MAG TPA: NTP transferase domain-containing protein [Vicinamibacterales bacterium]|nr:NTP transferase domain-containing protein [Vicinamibacterales bacterium]